MSSSMWPWMMTAAGPEMSTLPALYASVVWPLGSSVGPAPTPWPMTDSLVIVAGPAMFRVTLLPPAENDGVGGHVDLRLLDRQRIDNAA
jgi:hypothetical protein